MPNWCSTDIYFTGDTESITDLFNKVTEYTSKEFMKSSFGPMWLGNVVLGFGIETAENISHKSSVRCRGSINHISDIKETDNDHEFFIQTETAWEPMLKMWTEIIKRNYSDEDGNPKITITYLAYEPGNGLYCTNDMERFGANKFDYDITDEENDIYESGWASTEDDVVKSINHVIEKRGITLKSLDPDEIDEITEATNDKLMIDIIELTYQSIDAWE